MTNEIKSEEVLKNKWALMIWDWQHGGTSFYCGLLTLLRKADPGNKAKIGLMWPELYYAYCEWHFSKTEEEYFSKYGLN